MIEKSVMEYPRRSRLHPHQFALYASMASMIMMFGAFTSAYLVRQAAGNWQEYVVPDIFYLSTAILLISSATLHYAYTSFKQEQFSHYRIFLIITFALGLAFVIMQYFGWQQLYNIGVPLDGNPSGSFFYVISGVHAAHVLGGIAALFVAAYHALSLAPKVTEKRRTRFSLVVQYWHFVDLLWLYLLVFILIAH